MPNYNETSVSGTRWTRCREIHIQNPHASRGVPTVTFVEEEVINMGSDYMPLPKDHTVFPTINTIMFDPAAVINVYDPVTCQPTGTTMSMGEVYVALFSAYMTEATKRDAAVTK